MSESILEVAAELVHGDRLSPPSRAPKSKPSRMPLRYLCGCGETDPDKFCPTKGDKCRPCLAAWQRQYRKRRTQEYWITKDRQYALKKRYGLTAEAFKALWDSQGGRCAICKCDPRDYPGPAKHRRLHVDHDHATGAVRGLLCNGCNRAIGFVKEDLSIVDELRGYLERHQHPAAGV